MVAGPASRPGRTSQLSPSSSIPMPSARKASAIRSVSRLRNGATISDGPVACAARMSARLVSDLDPGIGTVARTGADATGAAQSVSGEVPGTAFIRP